MLDDARRLLDDCTTMLLIGFIFFSSFRPYFSIFNLVSHFLRCFSISGKHFCKVSCRNKVFPFPSEASRFRVETKLLT
eukprot:6296004-Amphidinium_carterae.1